MPFFPDLLVNQGVSAALLTLNESSQDEIKDFASQVGAEVQANKDNTDGVKNNLSFGPIDFSYTLTAAKAKQVISDDAYKTG